MQRRLPGADAVAGVDRPGGLAEQLAERTGKTREQVLDEVARGRPIGRMAESSEIAAVVAFQQYDGSRSARRSSWHR